MDGNTHLIFDLLAVFVAALLTFAIWRWRLRDVPENPVKAREGYFISLGAGMTLGSYTLGTLNLWLSGVPMFGRSILGALAGAILAVELYKRARGISGSTGLLFVPTFAALVAVGRIGCAVSGLEDHTFGSPTALPWGHDFGDGVLRHPVAVYESLCMAAFLTFALWAFARHWPPFMARGFYMMVAFYAAQRFLWEFLKPYAAIVGPLNIFQLTCVLLVIYAGFMTRRTR